MSCRCATIASCQQPVPETRPARQIQRGARAPRWLLVCAALLLGAPLSAAAEDRATGPGRVLSGFRDIPSLFGDIEAIVWVDDPNDDAPSGGLDILGVGLGRVDITAPAAVRESADLLRLGKSKKAVPKGMLVLDERTTKAFGVTTRNVEAAHLMLWPVEAEKDAWARARGLVDNGKLPTEVAPIQIRIKPKRKRNKHVVTAVD